MPYKNITCLADKTDKAQAAKRALVKRYGFSGAEKDADEADALIVLGGDGFMLHMLHQQLRRPVPVYGMNCGTVGFLMNDYRTDDVLSRINAAKQTIIRPLQMEATDKDGRTYKAVAINEVSLLRQTYQAAHIRIKVDNTIRVKELVSDGVMVATSAGSTAYNFSVGGPIVPLDSRVLALTPISTFRPRHWRGALLPHKAEIRFDIMDYDKRPVSAAADFTEVRDVVRVDVKEMRNKRLCLLFDPEHGLEERIIREQFMF